MALGAYLKCFKYLIEEMFLCYMIKQSGITKIDNRASTLSYWMFSHHYSLITRSTLKIIQIK